jgi:two-component system cell cycle sensor histidine kinase/response regulator CckA
MTVVLVIDDNAQIRGLIKRSLSREAYTVLDWANPKDAIAYLETSDDEIELALIDGVMPEMLGPSVAAEIDRLRPDVPIMLMSGHEAPMFKEFFERPNRHFIAKPFVVSDLIARIAAILKSARD